MIGSTYSLADDGANGNLERFEGLPASNSGNGSEGSSHTSLVFPAAVSAVPHRQARLNQSLLGACRDNQISRVNHLINLGARINPEDFPNCLAIAIAGDFPELLGTLLKYEHRESYHQPREKAERVTWTADPGSEFTPLVPSTRIAFRFPDSKNADSSWQCGRFPNLPAARMGRFFCARTNFFAFLSKRVNKIPASTTTS